METKSANRGHVKQTAIGWIADVYVDGFRHQLKAPTKAKAQQRMAEALSGQISNRLTAQNRNTFTLKDALRLTEIVRWSRSDNEKTVRSSLSQAQQVLEYFGGGTELASIGPTEIENMREHFLQIGNRPSTINAKVSIIKVMRTDALLHGKVEALKPMPRQLKIVARKDETFTPDDVNRISGYFRKICKEEAADLFIFLIETGCRFCEAERLVATDISLDNGTVCFSKTKANRPRSIPLTVRAIEILRPRMPLGNTGKIWTLNYRQMSWLYDTARAALSLSPGLTLHSARHTCLSRLAQNGVSLPQLQAWGGHSQLANLQRYIHIQTDRLTDCVKALNSYN